jgi:hypothetical protein
MDKETAAALIDSLVGLGNAFGDITQLTYRIADEAERRRFRGGVADVMHAINFELIMPLVRQYPELDPDKPTGSNTEG